MEPRYTNCNECNDVVRRDEVDSEGICELCLEEWAEGCDVFVHDIFNAAGMYCPCLPDSVVNEHQRLMRQLITGRAS